MSDSFKLKESPEERAARLVRLKVDLVRIDGRLERLCEHLVGHTVGHYNARYPWSEDWFWVHGCDGCCEGYERDVDADPSSKEKYEVHAEPSLGEIASGKP